MENKIKLREYQKENASKIHERLVKYKMCYFLGMVRTGKSLTALEACKLFGAKRVLFLTKKKAISSIIDDYKDFGYTFELVVMNYESVHKIEGNEFDLIVYDESHCFSSYPKPSKTAKILKKRFTNLPMIFLTGTAAVESGSQWYHQLYVSSYSPFKEYSTFYKWSKDFVNVVQLDYGYGRVNNYDNADRDKIQEEIKHLLIIFTQEEAGFETIINEKVLYCQMQKSTYNLAELLISDRVYQGVEDVVLADTAVKLQNKLHQIYSGTVITEDKKGIVFDYSKVNFIRDYFKRKKLAIFYFFKAELKLLENTFGHELCTDLEEFNSTYKHIAIQQTGTEGMNLSKADAIVFYNFGFSGAKYIQSRDRLSVMDRKTNDVYFVFEKGGISEKIYKAVKDKKKYNSRLFKKDFL